MHRVGFDPELGNTAPQYESPTVAIFSTSYVSAAMSNAWNICVSMSMTSGGLLREVYEVNPAMSVTTSTVSGYALSRVPPEACRRSRVGVAGKKLAIMRWVTRVLCSISAMVAVAFSFPTNDLRVCRSRKERRSRGDRNITQYIISM